MTRIGIILGSTRPSRNGEQVARWVLDIASSRNDAEFELVDLRDYPLPHPRRAAAAVAWPVPARAHQGVGEQDRIVRRLCHRDP